MSSAGPRMSIVLATDRYETVARTLAALQAQTIRDSLEIVLVSLEAEPLALPDEAVKGFAAVRIVRPPEPLTLAEGRRAGVLEASADIVEIAESHAFPHPEWAERVLTRHEEGWGVVVPGFCNANPEGPISWANLLLDYGGWMDAVPAQEIDRLPPYNSSFERATAISIVKAEEGAFAPGYDLAPAIHARGRRIFHAPEARVDHVNVSLSRHWLVQRYISARAHAAVRSARWPLRRRILYALGSPLIPVVCLARISGSVRDVQRSRRLPRGTVGAMVLGAAAEGIGELAAFVARGGMAGPRSDAYELHKVNYTRMEAA